MYNMENQVDKHIESHMAIDGSWGCVLVFVDSGTPI